ncbi:MAG: hypothetical protein ABIT07_02620 [Ferruginibacter sp.]
MKYLPYKILILVFCAAVLISCKKETSAPPTSDTSVTALSLNSSHNSQTFYGPAVSIGKGVGRAWVSVNTTGKPIAMGVNLSATALLNQGTQQMDYVFEFPHQIDVTPFDHVEIGWNPQGHEPVGIYNVPHFDAHFYMITKEYQATIPFLAPPAFNLAPLAKYMPPAYIQTPGLVPNMGAHWVDVLSSEFQPQGSFTKTFIFGSYNGQVTFYEPMFTKNYLQFLSDGVSTTTTPVRQPQAFQRAGYYPTSYSIGYDTNPKEFTLSLNNLTYHAAN